jgi:histidine triad (HIT) family protein
MKDECIFCQIVNKKLPADIVFESDNLLAFRDIAPKAQHHILLIPKLHIESLQHASIKEQAILAELMLCSKEVMAGIGVTNGYRTVINTGKGGGQEVFHLHLHLLAGNLPTY